MQTEQDANATEQDANEAEQESNVTEQDPNATEQDSSQEEPQRSRMASIVSEVVFYLMLLIVIGVLLLSNTSNIPRNILGFSVLTILTRSMQSELPQGSFVLIRHVDQNTLQVGDDVTYLRSEDTTITHRIVAIYENYADTGKRGFQTMGVNNAAPDQEIVIADNVIGKVVFHSEPLGLFFSFVKHNILLSILIGTLILGLLFAMKRVFSRTG